MLSEIRKKLVANLKRDVEAPAVRALFEIGLDHGIGLGPKVVPNRLIFQSKLGKVWHVSPSPISELVLWPNKEEVPVGTRRILDGVEELRSRPPHVVEHAIENKMHSVTVDVLREPLEVGMRPVFRRDVQI